MEGKARQMKDQEENDIPAVMRVLGKAARGAASALSVVSTDMKTFLF